MYVFDGDTALHIPGRLSMTSIL